MKSENIMNGYKNGNFGPSNNVLYGEALKIIARSFGLISKEVIEPKGNDWPQPYYNVMKNILPVELSNNQDWNKILFGVIILKL